MNEARLGYLCTRAARGRLTLDEETELLSYIALEPGLSELVLLEMVLIEIRW
ncbi:MAG: hypothetical protein WDZ29_03280 [Balneolaceae bacterium]